jgi:hypothetical protein
VPGFYYLLSRSRVIPEDQIKKLEWALRSLLGRVHRREARKVAYFGIALHKAVMPRANGGAGVCCPMKRVSAMKAVWIPLLNRNSFHDLQLPPTDEQVDAH